MLSIFICHGAKVFRNKEKKNEDKDSTLDNKI